jgi:hypothetical protein
MTQGNLGDLGNLDVATLLQYLPGVRFPAEKEQIASTAESNGAPQELVEKIRVQAANDSMLLTRSCRRSKAAKPESFPPHTLHPIPRPTAASTLGEDGCFAGSAMRQLRGAGVGKEPARRKTEDRGRRYSTRPQGAC